MADDLLQGPPAEPGQTQPTQPQKRRSTNPTGKMTPVTSRVTLPRRRVRERKRAPQLRMSTAQQQAAFLAQYAAIGNITSAANLAKIDRQRHYEWVNDRVKYPDYPARFEQAIEQFKDTLERAIVQRGVYGLDRPIYQGGKLVGYERMYSDKLLELSAKAHMPSKYRERVDLTGAGGGPIEVSTLASVPVAALQERLVRAIEALTAQADPLARTIDVTPSQQALAPVGVPLPEETVEARAEREYAARLAQRKGGGNGHGPNGHG